MLEGSDKKLFEGGQEMISQEKLDEIRQALIDSLENSIEIYTRKGTEEWINESNCRELIEKLKKKESVRIGGPFWGEFLGGAIADHGVLDYGPTREEHFNIWKKIEKGLFKK